MFNDYTYNNDFVLISNKIIVYNMKEGEMKMKCTKQIIIVTTLRVISMHKNVKRMRRVKWGSSELREKGIII